MLTPIFHALSRGGWRGRQQEASVPVRPSDEVDQFRRDPLTAPIPIQALAATAVPAPAAPPAESPVDHAMRRRRAAHALAEPRPESGRHHYRLESAGATAG